MAVALAAADTQPQVAIQHHQQVQRVALDNHQAHLQVAILRQLSVWVAQAVTRQVAVQVRQAALTQATAVAAHKAQAHQLVQLVLQAVAVAYS